MLIIDKYAYTNKMKDVNPFLKFAAFLTGIVIPRITASYIAGITTAIVFTFITVFCAGIRFKSFIRLFKIPFFFAAVSILGILITVNAEDSFFQIQFGAGSPVLGISAQSIKQSTNLFFIVISSVSALYFFILTTPMRKIIYMLKKAGIPALIIELMILIYRSIFIFLEEYSLMNNAQILKFGRRNKKLILRSLALICVSLFERIYSAHAAMTKALELKLYSGEFKIGEQ